MLHVYNNIHQPKIFYHELFDDNTPFAFKDDDRVDGKLKVTGAAKYAAEYNIPNVAYGVLVGSTIAKGTIIH